MQSGIAHVVDVKGAFLLGNLRMVRIFTSRSCWDFEKFYSSNTVLLLKKMLYGLNQVAMAL
jgi:hypothetical protein